MEESDLRLNKDKCKLKHERLSYFGHVIDKDGVSPSDEKVKAIQEFSPPQNIKELKQYLGLVNYMGKFILNLVTVIQPMNNLQRADVAWIWGPTQDKAFQKVKDMLSSAPILALYDATKPTIMSVGCQQLRPGSSFTSTAWRIAAPSSLRIMYADQCRSEVHPARKRVSGERMGLRAV